MSTEDFSFPTNNFPCIIDSPPLWRLSSATSSDSATHEETSNEGLENEQEDDDKSINFSQRKSFSCVEEKNRYESSKEKEEEKMDMLWEDFNEELMPKNKISKSDDFDNLKSSTGEIVELGCVPAALKFNRTSNSLLSARNNKPAGIIELLKVLKKIFMLHSTHHHTHKS